MKPFNQARLARSDGATLLELGYPGLCTGGHLPRNNRRLSDQSGADCQLRSLLQDHNDLCCRHKVSLGMANPFLGDPTDHLSTEVTFQIQELCFL